MKRIFLSLFLGGLMTFGSAVAQNSNEKANDGVTVYEHDYIVKVGEGDNQKSDFDAASFAKKLQMLNRKPRMY